jgi:predicted metal-dependent HD superfamily phosphohydrolase
MSTDLRKRWQALARELGLRDADALGDGLIGRYAEAHRRFHDQAHLRQVLDVLDALGADPRLHFAAWFHDAIYRPGRRGNERASARLARQCLGETGLPSADVAFVARAVLATAGHADADPAFAPLLDADLAVLGGSAEEYQHYRARLREEFAGVPAVLFGFGRRAFLRGMLARPSIFHTPACQQRYEAPARRNLRDELADLARSMPACS